MTLEPTGVFHTKSSLLTYIKIHGPFMEPQSCGEVARVTQWSYEPCCVGPPEMDRSQWRVLTKRDPQEEGVASHENLMKKEKRVSENEMAGWHHRCNGNELGQTLGGGEEQGGLTCCSPWDRRGRHNWVTEQQQQDTCSNSSHHIHILTGRTRERGKERKCLFLRLGHRRYIYHFISHPTGQPCLATREAGKWPLQLQFWGHWDSEIPPQRRKEMIYTGEQVLSLSHSLSDISLLLLPC